ncbi:MAG: hypothetical protein Ta2D_06690 [Rickettsiales bacterium]|nr:MAG: hypothetical protein Ta2D_06690 [Rickettsiales bacterium]
MLDMINHNTDYTSDYFTIQSASLWASSHFNKSVTPANITYLLNYGKNKKLIFTKN